MQDDDWIWRGIVFEYQVDQAVLIFDRKASGRVLGRASMGGSTYIVKLDQCLSDGSKATLVHADNMRLLDCHWCQDSKQVAVTPFTEGQYNTDTIPTKECPYCSGKKAVYV